tara:strand:- start:3798 stop:3992 length:195 start_codon:yes stop_codon:yes gene_type:complete
MRFFERLQKFFSCGGENKIKFKSSCLSSCCRKTDIKVAVDVDGDGDVDIEMKKVDSEYEIVIKE